MNFPNLSLGGLAGVQTGLENLKRDANDIAQSVSKGGENTSDLAKSMVDLNLDQRQVEASVKVVQAVDEVLGSLIDIKA
jgi:flagellar hook protein FlgE